MYENEEVLPTLTIAVTGHRPPKLGLQYSVAAGNLHVYKPMIRLLDELGSEVEIVRVLTGMALGVDQLMADACRDTYTPYTAVVPFLGQESRWPPAVQGYYRRLLDDAVKVIVVSDGGYAAWKMQVRNEWMVDHADRLYAWWDGSSGGTANCVAYARKQGVPVYDGRTGDLL